METNPITGEPLVAGSQKPLTVARAQQDAQERKQAEAGGRMEAAIASEDGQKFLGELTGLFCHVVESLFDPDNPLEEHEEKKLIGMGRGFVAALRHLGYTVKLGRTAAGHILKKELPAEALYEGILRGK